MNIFINLFALAEEPNLLGLPAEDVNPVIAGTITFLVVVTVLLAMQRK